MGTYVRTYQVVSHPKMGLDISQKAWFTRHKGRRNWNRLWLPFAIALINLVLRMFPMSVGKAWNNISPLFDFSTEKKFLPSVVLSFSIPNLGKWACYRVRYQVLLPTSSHEVWCPRMAYIDVASQSTTLVIYFTEFEFTKSAWKIANSSGLNGPSELSFVDNSKIYNSARMNLKS